MNDETSKLIAKVERFARQGQLFAPAEPGRFRAPRGCRFGRGRQQLASLWVTLSRRKPLGILTACHVKHGPEGEIEDRTKPLSGQSAPGWECR